MNGEITQAVTINGAELLADFSGALVWPERKTIFVADLHFEKGSYYGARGRHIPPYDTAATLDALETVFERHRPERVFCLGDSFHDSAAGERIASPDQERLAGLVGACHWTWITGNHDPSPEGPWGGEVMEEAVLGPLVLRHEAQAGTVGGELSGHFHPKAAVRVRGRRLSRRAFVFDASRLILPAFGAFTGGLSVLNPAISSLFGRDFQAILIGRGALYRYPGSALVA